MKAKAKGIGAERELVHLFWNAGWTAIRVAGSGAIKYPCPDVLASNNLRKIAVECKTVKDAVYINKKQIEELKKFAVAFGAEAWVGLRFDKKDWFFLSTEDLKETNAGFSANLASCRMKGLLFEQLVEAKAF